MSGTMKRGTTWTAIWHTVDPATGKRHQHTKGGFRTKKAATDHLATIANDVRLGVWKPDTKLTVGQLLTAHWLPSKRSEGLRPATIDQYESVIDAWILPHLGELDVRQLTPATVQELVEQLATSGSTLGRGGLSTRSLQMVVTVLKAATRWAAVTGLTNRDQLAGYKRPKLQTKQMSSWSTEEARTFLTATRADRMAAAWALLLTRGLRRGELAGLRWDVIDLESGTLRVVATRVVVDGKAVDSTPKTDSGRRSVPLDPHLVVLLRAHRKAQAAERLLAGEAWADTGLVFVNEIGEPYHPDHFSDRFVDLTADVGLRRIRLHDTRHTAASLMLAAGVPVKVVSEMLGHSSPTLTLSVYQHVLPSMGEQAGAALSASLLG